MARIITSGGSMLARTLYENPMSTYRPMVQTKLTTTAPITSSVSRHERNMKNSAPTVRQDRRRQVSQIRLRDLVVGLADLEAAAVRLHALREPRVDQAMNPVDHILAHVVYAVFVERDDDRRDCSVLRNDISPKQPVRENAFTDAGRRLLGR